MDIEFDYSINKFIHRLRDFIGDFNSVTIEAADIIMFLKQGMFKDVVPIKSYVKQFEKEDGIDVKLFIQDLIYKKAIKLSTITGKDINYIINHITKNFIFIYGRSLGPVAPPRVSVPINPDLSGPDTVTLGIFINLHGEFAVNTQFKPIVNTNFPLGVQIRKQNVASYGCSSSITPEYDTREVYDLAEHTLLDYRFEKCIDKKQYIQSTRAVELEEYELHREEGSCELIEGVESYYEKIYNSVKDINHLIFIKNDDPYGILKFYRKVNLVDCTKGELYDFFYGNPINKTKYKSNELIEQFMESRSNGITTTTLFHFIQLAHDTLHITKVNIIDTSCSVIPSDNPDDPHGYKVPTSYNWRKTRIGYGGRKTRRKSFKKRHL